MPAHVQSSTASSTCGSRRDESLHVSSHALCLFGHELHRQVSRRLGGFAEQLFRSEERARALQPLSRRARARRRARLRRHIGQRASPERLWADAIAGGDGGRARAPDQEREDRDPRQRLLPARAPAHARREHAMLDCITAGRLITGMVRGIGAEYYSLGSNPAFSHARFQEAHDLAVQSWTRPGPFAFEGNYYHFEYVNVWPRPYQQPHPPIWAPSTGSTETIEWAAHPSRKYVYLQAYSPIHSVVRYLNYYREAAQRLHGYTASSDRIGWSAPVYVSDTDAKARAEAGRHIETLFNKFLRLPFQMLFPPGYLSAKSLKNMLTHKRSVAGQEHTVDTLIG